MLGGVVPPKVFVSYVHESRDHQDRVVAFARFLREQGVDAVLDVWSAGSRHDWYAWAIREMTDAAYVVVVASPTYRAVGDGSGAPDRNRGVQSEAALLRELVYEDRVVWTPKVLPVLLPGHTVGEIPRFLSPHTTSRYDVTALTRDGAENLLRVIHEAPAHVPPPVGERPDLPPRTAPSPLTASAETPQRLLGYRDRADLLGLILAPVVKTKHSWQDMSSALEGCATSRFQGKGRLSGADTMVSLEVAEMVVEVHHDGTRSASFRPENDLATQLAGHIELLLDIGLDRPESWVPVIHTREAQVYLPAVPAEAVEPGELAARLARELRAKTERTSDVTNTITGNVSGKVIQARDIHGGVHF